MAGPEDPDGKNVRMMADVLAYGWVLPAAIAAGAGLGYLVDRIASSFPWATGIGGAIGFVAGIRDVLRRASSFGDAGGSKGK